MKAATANATARDVRIGGTAAVPSPETDVSGDFITIARTRSLIQTKAWRPTPAGKLVKAAGGKHPRLFRYEHRQVNNLDDLATAIRQIARDPRACVLRGRALVTGAKLQLRRLHPREGEPATLVSAPHRYVALDVDSLPLPAHVSRTDAEAVASHVIDTLPPPFWSTRVVVQLTSSAGIADGARIRLWFWLSRPTSDAELKTWLANVRVDQAIFSPAQPIYTAAPIFLNGASDPCRERLVVLDGVFDAVDVPAPAELVLLPANPKRRTSPKRVSEMEGADEHVTLQVPGRGWRRYIAADVMCDQSLGGHGFFAPMKAAIGSFVHEHGPDAPPEALYRALGAALDARAAGIRGATYVAQRKRQALELHAFAAAREREKRSRGLVPCDSPLLPTLTVGQAEAEAGNATRRFLRRAGGRNRPLPGLVLVDTGVGKTALAIQESLQYLQRHQEHHIAYWVPTHELAEDVRCRFVAAGAAPDEVAVFFGMERADPRAADNSTQVCRRAAEARVLIEARESVELLCGSADRGFCPHRATCYYRWQRAAIKRARVVIFCGPSPIHAPPDFLDRKPAFNLTIWDEPNLLNLAQGLDDKSPTRITPSELESIAEAAERAVNDAPLRRALDFQSLADLCRQLVAMGRGPRQSSAFKMTELLSVGIDDWRQLKWLRDAAWRLRKTLRDRLRGDEVSSVQELEHRLKSQLARNRAVLRTVRMLYAVDQAWSTASPAATRIPQLIWCHTDQGFGLQIRWRERPHLGWGPLLLLDATANIDLARTVIPDLELLAEARVALSDAVRVRQVYDWTGNYYDTKAALDASELEAKDFDPKDTERARAASATRRLMQVEAFIEVEAARLRDLGRTGGLLVIGSLDVERWMKRHWTTGERTAPEGVQLLHFGALRGLDDYASVSGVIVIGRPQIPAERAEAIAGVLRGTFGERLEDGRYEQRHGAAYSLADGTGRLAIYAASHPDPIADAVRATGTEAELLQGIGRGRGVRRTLATPLDVTLIGSTPLTGVPVAELLTFDQLMAEAGVAALAAARGIVPEPGQKGCWELLATVVDQGAASIELRARSLKSNAKENGVADELVKIVGRIEAQGHERLEKNLPKAKMTLRKSNTEFPTEERRWLRAKIRLTSQARYATHARVRAQGWGEVVERVKAVLGPNAIAEPVELHATSRNPTPATPSLPAQLKPPGTSGHVCVSLYVTSPEDARMAGRILAQLERAAARVARVGPARPT